MERGKKLPPSPILDTLRDACHNEGNAVAFLEAHRWGSTPACPRCGSLAVYQMRDATTGARNKDWRWRCRDCKRMYTVRTGTVFEETRLPLRHWCFALWSAASNKKGVAALQISRECEISYKSALYLMHRIRRGMSEIDGSQPKLSGTVEADETYVGGKPRYKGPHNKRGLGTAKIPIIAVVQRGGDVRARVLDRRVNSADIKAALAENVDLSSRLITDESVAYETVGKMFAGGHETVKHTAREYVRGDVHSNTIEGVFATMKRGLIGVHHSASKKHLHRYVAQYVFLYNNRKCNDGERVIRLVKATDGKRLTYAQQVAG